MLKRTIAICLAVLLCTSALIPFVDSNAHGFRHSAQVGQRRSHRYRSRAWWRRYRARLRKKRAAAAALAAHRNSLLTLPQNLNVRGYVTIPKTVANATLPAQTYVPTTPVTPAAIPARPTVRVPPATLQVPPPRGMATMVVPARPTLPVKLLTVPARVNLPAKPAIPSPATVPATPATVSTISSASRPRTVTRPAVVPPVAKPLPTAPVLTNSATRLPTLTNTPVPAVKAAPAPVSVTAHARAEANNIGSEAIVRSKNPVTPLPGQLSISVVALARPNPAFLTTREQSRLLAGINVAELRKIVIDKMVVAGGWVTNDYVHEINGARVFVVTAHTPKDAHSPAKVWTFFFTESAGRIYSLATESPVEHAGRMTKEAERFIRSLQSSTPAETPQE